MKFALVNESTEPTLTFDVLTKIAGAIQTQLYEHYAPLWEGEGCDVLPCAKLADAPTDAAVIAVLDDSDQAGALGYHDVTPDGRPYARVFVRPTLDNGGTLTSGPNSVSVTVSHEVLETVGDPYANWWADGPAGKEYALELCDPVEGDAYDIDGVSVSNFVGPRWFDPNGPGPYDWLKKLSVPFTMTPGGYMITRTSATDVSQVFGEHFPEWKKPLKSRILKRHATRAAA